MIVLATFTLREALRRRVFLVVAILTLAFLALYALGVWEAFRIVDDFGGGVAGVEPRVVTGATMFGLSMFGTLFLGTVLGVFLTLGAVRGDAERGLLQPVLVRPLSRREMLLARLLSAGSVCAAYVLLVYLAAMVITGAIGEWWPDRVVAPGLGLALAVVVITALSLTGSVFLASTANGIAIFMLFGAGLVAGLLGQIGEALDADKLDRAADIASWILPFEALYQAGLADLTADTGGLTGLALSLGPFGGAEDGSLWLWVWSIAYIAGVMAAASAAFARRDL